MRPRLRSHLRPSAPITLSLMLVSIVLLSGSVAQGQHLTSVTVPNTPIAEGNDFATRVLADPWDMSEYSDISQYLNESGQRRLVNNPTVADGIFSGSSFSDANSGDGNPYFFPIFPGYIGQDSGDPLAIPAGDRIGYNYPISANNSCLSIALNTQSPKANAFGPDVMRIFWFADRTLNVDATRYGMTYIQLYPEAAAALPTPRWQVISLNLASPPNGVSVGKPWTSQSAWQGLRIDPTAIAAGTSFAVDWVRLTDCAPVKQTISWTPDANIKALWLRPSGTTRNIRLTTVSGASGSASVDFQGVAAGSYQVGLGTLTGCCTQSSEQPIIINQAPTGQFVAPSFISGQDYATQAGNPWDFATSGSDGSVVSFTPGTTAPTATYDGDGLLLSTPTGPLPAGVDVAIKLNMPQTITPATYRYLTIDMETTWKVPWENIPDGMIGRWIWSIQGTSGRAGYRCTIVGPDIPYDIGRQLITIDFLNPLSSVAEESQGECPTGALNWTTGQILELRFDPNENVTGVNDAITGGGPFTQRIRSIRLSKEDTAKAGGTYLIRMNLNKDPANINTTFYYTTNPAQPTQHLAGNVAASVSGPNHVYLPLLQQTGLTQTVGPNARSFTWNLAGVAPGTYYVCAVLNDGLNSQTICSRTSVLVQ